MEQLDKWNKELENLESKRFKETDSELFNLYRKSLVDIKKRLYKYAEEYENLSFSNRLEVERYFQVAKEVEKILATAYPDVESTIKNHVTESAEQGYYGLWYGIEESQKINLAMPLINHDYIQNIVNQPVAGKRLSKRLYDNRDALAKNVTNNIVEGLFAGKGYKYTAKRVSDQTEASYRQSLRIVRTESGRVQSTTNQKSAENAKALGIDMQKKWLSTLDKRTRRHHQELDGQTVDIEEEFTINGHSALGPRLFGVAEQDINCRCTTINIVNGITPEMRYDQENGERIPFQSYEEWLEGKNGSDEREVVDNEISYNDSLAKTNMEKMVGKENYENFVEHLNHIDNERVKQMFNLLGDKISFKPISNAHPHARGSNIQLDITSFVGNQYHYPMKTVYHEAGHAFDSLGMELLTGKNGFAVGKKKIKVLGKMVEVDENVYHASGLPDYKLKESFNRDLWRAINGPDLQMFEDLGTKPRKRAEKREWEDKRSEIYSALQKNSQKFQTEYKDKFKENPSMYVALSDMMESTGWFYGTLGAGHGKDYWKKTGMAETEFFAHATEMVASKEAEKVMREIFPTGINAWEKLVDDMLERVK